MPPASTILASFLAVALVLATGCDDPARVTPVDNTGSASDAATSGLDAIGGLDSHDGGGTTAHACATGQDCATIASDAPACQVPVCVKAICVFVNAADASPCDDENPCTTATTCLGGSCLKGSAVICDDSNPCTDDACGLPGGCTFTANHATCGGAGCDVGACASGACSTKPRFGAAHWADQRFRALIADQGGWAAAMQVAVTSTDAALPAAQSRWVRIDVGGAVVQDLPVAVSQVEAVTRTFTGDFVFVGADVVLAASGGAALDGVMARVRTDGSERWRRTYHRGHDDRLNAAVGLDDDTVAACGRTAKAGGAGEAWLVRGSAPTGFPLLDYIYGSADDETCNSLVQLPGGDLLMSGAQTGGSGQGQALAFRVQADAKLVWYKSWGGSGHDEIFTAVVRPDGAAWLAGTCAEKAGSAGRACVWLLSSSGDVLLTRALLKPGLGGAQPAAAAQLFAIGLQSTGGFVVAGRAKVDPTGSWRAFASWRDASANPIATRFPDPGPGWLRALVVDAQGAVALAGAASTTQAVDASSVAAGAPAPAVAGAAVLLRMTSSGLPCHAAATCAGQPVAACDDGDPCTVDWCGVACDHAPLAEGAPCSLDKTCIAGVCTSAP